MKYMRQLAVILGVSFLGEVLRRCLPLPVPAGIYALVILFFGLLTRAIPLRAVEETADFLTGIMQLMFIPALVGLMASYAAFGQILLPAVILVTVGTGCVIFAAGRTAQWANRIGGKRHE